MSLKGKVALVTGASRGIGKGIALQLADAGATVYITGRTANSSSTADLPGNLEQTVQEIESRGGKAVAVGCDHSKDDQVKQLFQQIQKEQGTLDILVNNANAGMTFMQDNLGKPFWEISEEIWDLVNGVALRNNYKCSVKAAKIMVKQKSGFIVNISSLGGQEYFVTPVYGIGKKGKDRMAADCGFGAQAAQRHLHQSVARTSENRASKCNSAHSRPVRGVPKRGSLELWSQHLS